MKSATQPSPSLLKRVGKRAGKPPPFSPLAFRVLAGSTHKTITNLIALNFDYHIVATSLSIPLVSCILLLLLLKVTAAFLPGILGSYVTFFLSSSSRYSISQKLLALLLPNYIASCYVAVPSSTNHH
jgi:hypothetical protein